MARGIHPSRTLRRRLADAGIELVTPSSPDAAGTPDVLPDGLRTALSLPNSIVTDESELGRLNLSGPGDTAKISGVEVTLVGTIHGMKSLAAPWIICSETTARKLLWTSALVAFAFIVSVAVRKTLLGFFG